LEFYFFKKYQIISEILDITDPRRHCFDLIFDNLIILRFVLSILAKLFPVWPIISKIQGNEVPRYN